MEIEILSENGFDQAMYGLSLSYNSDLSRMPARARVLSDMDDGHNKFLESMQIWVRIKAPRYFWSEFDTYRVGVSKQSESTMHTLNRRELTQSDFEYTLPEGILSSFNTLLKNSAPLEVLKNALPEGFLQERVVNLNYKVVRHIIKQRSKHKLPQWLQFCRYMLKNLKYAEYLGFSPVDEV